MLIKNSGSGLVNGSMGTVTGFQSTVVNAETINESVHKEERRRVIKVAAPQAAEYRMKNPTLWPLVTFQDGRTKLCIGEKFSIENALGEEEALRIQVPLILAWAMSIHKSQGVPAHIDLVNAWSSKITCSGQTLERVKINCQHIFEKGQGEYELRNEIEG